MAAFLRPSAALGVFSLVLCAIAALVFHGAVRIPPYDADNLVVLTTSSRAFAEPWELFTGSFVSYIPGYRPLPYLTIWAQYRVWGVDTEAFFVVNLALWVGCGLGAAALALRLAPARLSGSALAGAALAGVALVLDQRGRAAIYWIGERQASMACVLGAGALLLALHHRPGHRGRLAEAGIFLLLLGAFLSKEYGLAVGAAVLAVVVARGRPFDLRLAGVAVGAVAVYGLMRLALAGGANPPYCEQMGFFGERRSEVCYDDVGPGYRLTQHLYNVGATLVGTLLPTLFEDDGVLRGFGPETTVTRTQFLKDLLLPAVIAAAAVAAWIRHTRATLPLLALVVANAALSFMLYRDRNPLVGMIGLYASAGITLGEIVAGARITRARTTAAVAAAAVLLGLLVRAGTLVGDRVEAVGAEVAVSDPCEAYAAYRDDIDPALVRRIKVEDELPDVDCVPSTPR